MMRKQVALLLTLALCVCLLAGCGGGAEPAPAANPEESAATVPAETPTETGEAADSSAYDNARPDVSGNSSQVEKAVPVLDGGLFSLHIDDYSDQWALVSDADLGMDYYVLRAVPYVSRPTAPSKQVISLFVPAAYMNEDGSLNPDGEVNGYTAETAPIFFPNNIGGYMESDPVNVKANNIAGKALQQGCVVASPGTRGRNSTTSESSLDGRAPEGIVDLKAAVRFLKANDAILAGDSEKIISDGTSAGGAMSILLAVSGDLDYYESYLKGIGAAEGSDTIFAAFVFCPITDLENADMAYEWYFGSLEEAYGGKSSPKGAVDPAISTALSAQYDAYVADLELSDEDGSALLIDDGSYRQYLVGLMNQALNEYLQENCPTPDEVAAYISEAEKDGHWIDYDAENNTASVTSLEDMLCFATKRMKNAPAFDFMDVVGGQFSGENDEFGVDDGTALHFSPSVKEALEAAGYADLAALFAEDLADPELQERVYYMNPMNFLGNALGGDARHFYIRVGNEDSDAAPVVSMNIALRLMNLNEGTVNYKIEWEKSHRGDYSEDEMFAWLHSICR